MDDILDLVEEVKSKIGGDTFAPESVVPKVDPREQAIRDRNKVDTDDELLALVGETKGQMEIDVRRQQRAYAEKPPTAIAQITIDPAREMVANLGDRAKVLDIYRSLSPEQRAEALMLAPGIAQQFGDDRGNFAQRTLGAVSRGFTHLVTQPAAELVGAGGTDEEIEFVRQLDAAASQEFHPYREDDPWYQRGFLQATEMAPWMATVVGGNVAGTAAGKMGGQLLARGAAAGVPGAKTAFQAAGALGRIPQATGTLGKVQQAVGLGSRTAKGVFEGAGGLAGITAASFPGQYAQEVDQLKELGMEDGVWLRALAGGTALITGAVEGLVPNPFKPGKVSLTDGAVKAARQYLWNAAKSAPGEVTEEYLQGVTSGLGKTVAGWLDENAEDRTVVQAFQDGFEQAKESLLPLSFLLGIPAVGGAGYAAIRTRINSAKQKQKRIQEILKKGYVSAEEAKEIAVEGVNRPERRANAKAEGDRIAAEIESLKAQLESAGESEASPEDATAAQAGAEGAAPTPPPLPAGQQPPPLPPSVTAEQPAIPPPVSSQQQPPLPTSSPPQAPVATPPVPTDLTPSQRYWESRKQSGGVGKEGMRQTVVDEARKVVSEGKDFSVFADEDKAEAYREILTESGFSVGPTAYNSKDGVASWSVSAPAEPASTPEAKSDQSTEAKPVTQAPKWDVQQGSDGKLYRVDPNSKTASERVRGRKEVTPDEGVVVATIDQFGKRIPDDLVADRRSFVENAVEGARFTREGYPNSVFVVGKDGKVTSQEENSVRPSGSVQSIANELELVGKSDTQGRRVFESSVKWLDQPAPEGAVEASSGAAEVPSDAKPDVAAADASPKGDLKRALNRWKGDPSSMQLLIGDIQEGKTPSSPNGSDAAAILDAVSSAPMNTVTLYRGDSESRPGVVELTSDRKVAEGFAKRYGGTVQEFPAGTVQAVEIEGVIRRPDVEKGWIGLLPDSNVKGDPKSTGAVPVASQSEEVSDARGTKKGGGPNEVQTEGGQRQANAEAKTQGQVSPDKNEVRAAEGTPSSDSWTGWDGSRVSKGQVLQTGLFHDLSQLPEDVADAIADETIKAESGFVDSNGNFITQEQGEKLAPGITGGGRSQEEGRKKKAAGLKAAFRVTGFAPSKDASVSATPAQETSTESKKPDATESEAAKKPAESAASKEKKEKVSKAKAALDKVSDERLELVSARLELGVTGRDAIIDKLADSPSVMKLLENLPAEQKPKPPAKRPRPAASSVVPRAISNGGRAKIVKPKKGSSEAKQEEILDAMGVTLRLIEGGSMKQPGLFEARTMTIWINLDYTQAWNDKWLADGRSPESMTWGLFAHEAFHAMRVSNPEAWNRLYKWVLERHGKDLKAAGEAYISDSVVAFGKSFQADVDAWNEATGNTIDIPKDASFREKIQAAKDAGMRLKPSEEGPADLSDGTRALAHYIDNFYGNKKVRQDESLSRYLEDRAGDFGFWRELGKSNPKLLEKIGRWLRKVLRFAEPNTTDPSTLAGQVRLAIESAMAENGIAMEERGGGRAAVGKQWETSPMVEKLARQYARVLTGGRTHFHGLKGLRAWLDHVNAPKWTRTSEAVDAIMQAHKPHASQARSEVKKIQDLGDIPGQPPPDVKTVSDHEAKRATLRKWAELAKAGRFWYEKSGDVILGIAKGSKRSAEKIINLIAITSSQTPVSGNWTFTMQMWSRYQTALHMFANEQGLTPKQVEEMVSLAGSRKTLVAKQAALTKRQLQKKASTARDRDIRTLQLDVNELTRDIAQLQDSLGSLTKKATDGFIEKFVEYAKGKDLLFTKDRHGRESDFLVGKTGSQAQTAERVLFRGEMWDGRKTNNFYINLMRNVDPDGKGHPDNMGVTVDVHIMRAVGYSTDSPTDAQYDYAEFLFKQLADDLGWEPQQVQAAVWEYQKYDREVVAPLQTALKKAKNSKAKPAVIEKIQAELNEAIGVRDRGEIPSMDFADVARRQITTMTYEGTPYPESGVLPEMAKQPLHIQEEYLADLEAALLDENGDNLVDLLLGLYSLETRSGTGLYKGDFSAGRQRDIVSAFAPQTKQSYLELDPIVTRLLDARAAIIGLLFRQDAVAYHKPFFTGSFGRKFENGSRLNFGQPITADQMVALESAIRKEMVARLGEEAGNAAADDTVLVPNGSGVLVLNTHKSWDNSEQVDEDIKRARAELGRMLERHASEYDAYNEEVTAKTDISAEQRRRLKAEKRAGQEGEKDDFYKKTLLPLRMSTLIIDNQKFRAIIKKAAEADGVPDGVMESFGWDGGYISNTTLDSEGMPEKSGWKENSDGQGYRQGLRAGGFGSVLERVDLELSPLVEAVNRKWEQRLQQGGSRAGVGKQEGVGQRRGASGRDPRHEAPLADAPKIRGATGPDRKVVRAAEKYAESAGIDLKRQATYVDIDENLAARLAKAYEDMADDPLNPKVAEAYRELIKQTTDQYQALVDEGFSFYFFDGENDPYGDSDGGFGNPYNAIRDLRTNQRMAVFPTSLGYGTDLTSADYDIERNPLLADTGIKWPWGSPDGPLRPVLANDLFRAVHDTFGHSMEGAGFRARGEENAWQAHVRLFYGPAVGAMTSETRGQNSYLNFGPHGEKNKTAKVLETEFAPQKVGLMPEWTWTEGRAADYPETTNKETDDEETNRGGARAAVTRGDLLEDPGEDGPVPSGHRGGATPSYGKAREGAVSYVGRHYSKQPQESLSGAYSGTGMPGAEGKRVRYAYDQRIKSRVYYYVETAGEIKPEIGVGDFAHETQLNNLYDPASNLIDHPRDPNEFESAVIDAGFDGYVIKPYGMAVLLGPQHASVPVRRAPEYDRGGRAAVARQSGDDLNAPDLDSNIRFAVARPEVAKKLNVGKKVKLYRAMMLIDGKLYPPMSGKVKGDDGKNRLREPEQIGVWMQSEERPDLIPTTGKNAGKFLLRKGGGDGSDVWVAYAPYFHASPMPLNDQFSAAWKNDGIERPQLVTVEVEVPASEMTSGYQAEKSPKKVGSNQWKAGVVASKIPGGREVILSRYARIKRIVPDAEVAEKIAEIVNPNRLAIPVNMVTPQLRKELEKLGVKIAPEYKKGDDIRYAVGRQTETPAFKKWFGDSKVVDEDGKPLVVYHGTRRNFSKFSKKVFPNFTTPQDKLGFFFAADAEYAGQYAEGEGGQVMPVYLSISSPKRESLSKIDEIENGTRQQAGRYIAQLKREGYDGIIFGDNVEIVAFSPTQIKSATGNTGEFDPSNPDVRYAAGREDDIVDWLLKQLEEQGVIKPEQKSDPGATGTKYARTEGQRTSVGDSPREWFGPRDVAVRQQQAIAELAANPGRPYEIVAQMDEKPRPLTDMEDAILNARIRELKNKGDIQGDDRQEWLDLNRTVQRGHSEWGYAGHAAQAELAPDFSLEGLTQEHFRYTGSQPTPEQMKEYAKQAARIEKLEEEKKELTKKLAKEAIARKKAEDALQKPVPPQEKAGTKRATLMKKVADGFAAFKDAWGGGTSDRASVGRQSDTSGFKKWFSEEAIASAKSESEGKSRSKLISMSIDDFLKMAESLGEPTPSKAKTVDRVLADGQKFSDVPYLGFTHDGKGIAKVVSHEGRHRAMALKANGVSSIPVLLRSEGSDAIRWNQQQKGGFDRISGEWPSTLQGQTSGAIAFPVLDPSVSPEALDSTSDRAAVGRQTETPAFKKWFGDSKVVDSDGKPLVVYHGTSSQFDAFKPSGISWFTTDITDAEDYQPANVLDTFLAIRNPASLDKKLVKSLLKKNGINPDDLFEITEQGDKVKEVLQSAGYDGLSVSRDDIWSGVVHYAAFSPTQIKSATANKGTFDPADPDIRYSPGRQEPNAKQAADGIVSALREMGVSSYLEFESQIKANIPDVSPEQMQVFKDSWDASTKKEKLESPMGPDPDDAAIGARAKELMTLAIEAGYGATPETWMEVVDVVHAQLSLEVPGIFEYETMQAMSDYGVWRPLNPEEVAVKTRAIRGKVRQSLKIEDLLEAISLSEEWLKDGVSPEEVARRLREQDLLPKATGREQATPDSIERDLIAQVNKLKKDLPVSAESREGQLKSALSTAKTAGRNRLEALDKDIEALEEAVSKREAMVKPVNDRAPLKPDQELIDIRKQLEAKRQRRAELKKEYEKIFPPTKKQRLATAEQQTDRAQKAIRDLKDKLQQLKDGKEVDTSRQPNLVEASVQSELDMWRERLRAARQAAKEAELARYEDDGGPALPLIGRKPLTEKQRLEMSEKMLQEQIDAVKAETKALESGAWRPVVKGEAATSDAIRALKDELASLKEIREQARKASPAYQAREEAKYWERYSKAQERRLAFWEKRREEAEAGRLPLPRKKRTITEEAILDKNLEIEKAQYEAMYAIEKANRANWNMGQWIGQGLLEVTSLIPKTLSLGMEMSFVLRQGFFYSRKNPIRAFQAVVESIPAVFSQRIALAAMEDIESRPNAKEYHLAKVDFTQAHGPKAKLEEMYQSSLIQWLDSTESKLLLPLRTWARAYAMLERGNRTFSNIMKADLYDIQKRDTLAAREFFGMSTDWTENDIQQTGRISNIFSGRGTGIRGGNPWMDFVFLARRWAWSRIQADFVVPFQLATPQWIGQWNADRGMRVALAKLYLQTLLGHATKMAVGYFAYSLLAGDDEEKKPTIEFDPRSSDAFIMKIGETRLKDEGGLMPIVILASRVLTGTTKTSTGEIKSIYGEDVQYGGKTAADFIISYGRYKLGTGPSAILEWAGGKDAVGKPITKTQIITSRMAPLTLKEIITAEKELGVAQGTLASLEAFFGISISTYGPRTEYRDADETERAEQFESDLKRMRWDTPDPAYKQFLDAEQMARVEARREEVKQGLVYAATASPDRKNYQDDKNFEESIARRDEAIKEAREAGFSQEEMRKLLLDYWKRTSKSAYELRGGQWVMKPQVAERLSQIKKTFGGN